jgi:hypothetical protein
VRDLSELSYNNALGIGLADITTDRLVNRIDSIPTLVNALTSSVPANVRTPIHFPTDRECLKTIALTVGKNDPADVTYAWIRNTLELSQLLLSENLCRQIDGNPDVEIIGAPYQPEFDQVGNLISPLAGMPHPASVVG